MRNHAAIAVLLTLTTLLILAPSYAKPADVPSHAPPPGELELEPRRVHFSVQGMPFVLFQGVNLGASVGVRVLESLELGGEGAVVFGSRDANFAIHSFVGVRAAYRFISGSYAFVPFVALGPGKLGCHCGQEADNPRGTDPLGVLAGVDGLGLLLNNHLAVGLRVAVISQYGYLRHAPLSFDEPPITSPQRFTSPYLAPVIGGAF